MRRLADAAQLSTRTLYNLHGAKEDILYALAEESIESLDEVIASLDLSDPLDRSRALIQVNVDRVCSRSSMFRALLRGLQLAGRHDRDAALLSRARSSHEQALRAAIDAGLLDPLTCPRLLGHHIMMAYCQAIRLWAAGMLDDDQLRAQSLHARAIYVQAAATPQSRDRLQREARELESSALAVVERLEKLFASRGLVASRPLRDRLALDVATA